MSIRPLSMRNALLALAFASVAMSWPVLAAETTETPAITVTATGEVNVEPDVAVLTLRVERFGRELQTAKREHDRAMQEVLALARRHGVPERDLQTPELRMDVVRESRSRSSVTDEERRSAPVRGYLVSSRLMIRLADLSRFEAFYGELLGTGITEVDNVRLEDSKAREHREAARLLAMKAARDKAAAMAGALGQTIGKAIGIVEGDRGMSAQPYANVIDGFTAPGAQTGGDTFARGELRIAATVTVTFRLD